MKNCWMNDGNRETKEVLLRVQQSLWVQRFSTADFKIAVGNRDTHHSINLENPVYGCNSLISN
jgi:hypothetical protein